MPKYILVLYVLISLITTNVTANPSEIAQSCQSPLNVNVRTLNDDKIVNLCQEYKNKVVLIVNTASKCGYTPQFEGLEQLYENYKAKGFVILGFPSNDFANQDPGTEKEIKSFCRLTYGVQFPMFAKTRVRKNHADPLYQELGKISGEFPAWNFHKYLLDRNGQFVASYPSATKPSSKKLVTKIESLLNK